MTHQLPDDRRQALLEAIPDEDGSLALISFLDSVDSMEELEALSLLFLKHAHVRDHWLLGYYKKSLATWPRPQLEESFKEYFPLVSRRLDTAWKIRIFLRAVEARGVPRDLMAKVFEELIYRRTVLGEDFLWYPQYRMSYFGTALRVVYHTEIPYWTLTRLMFHPDQPTVRGHCISARTTGLFLDWRSEVERKAIPLPW